MATFAQVQVALTFLQHLLGVALSPDRQALITQALTVPDGKAAQLRAELNI